MDAVRSSSAMYWSNSSATFGGIKCMLFSAHFINAVTAASQVVIALSLYKSLQFASFVERRGRSNWIGSKSIMIPWEG